MRARERLAFIAAALLVMYIVAPPARAAAVEFDCLELALGIARIADFRDVGADVDRVVRLARKQNAGNTGPHKEVIEREIRRLWRENLPAERAAQKVFDRCRKNLGDMGRES